MPDRPRSQRPRNDGSDGPEYQWLYGGRGNPADPADPDATRAIPRQPREDETRPIPRQPRADETRAMRAQPRPAPAGRPARPTPPPIAPPVEPARQGRGRGRRRWGPGRILLLLLVLWLAFMVATPLLAWTNVEKVDFDPGGDRPGDQPGTTYLLVGSDSRADLTEEQRRDLATGNAEGQRTDTIMLLHTGDGPNLLMSIPRDSIVSIPGHGDGQKINAAYAFGGPKLLVQTIENETGIRVDEFVQIGMGGVAGIVDAVGGIEICPQQRMVDKLAGLNVRKGCQEADGRTALAYARSRKTTGLGDIDRARRQREVVSSVGSTVLSPWTFVNPVRWWNLNHAIPDFFVFGEGTGPVRAGQWALAMTRVDGKAGLTCGVPIADLAVNWDEERAERLFAAIREDDTDSVGRGLCTPSGMRR